MVKLSLVVGVIALAASANADCTGGMTKCASDYATVAQSAGGDMSKMCAGVETYVGCFKGLESECTGVYATAWKQAADAAEAALAQMGSMCGGSSGSSSAGSSSGGGSDDMSACTDGLQKCASDYSSAAQSAGGDMSKTCSAVGNYIGCFNSLESKCTGSMAAAWKQSTDAAKSAGEQMKSMCGGSIPTGGGSSSSGGGSSGSGCDQTLADRCTASAGSLKSLADMSSTRNKISTIETVCGTGLTVLDSVPLCVKVAKCAMTSDQTKMVSELKTELASYCKAGPDADSVYEELMMQPADSDFNKCMGDYDKSAMTCELAEKMNKCFPKELIGTQVNESCKAFVSENKCKWTCGAASSGVKPSTVTPTGGPSDTGAASSAQVSAAVVIAAVAFVGMTN